MLAHSLLRTLLCLAGLVAIGSLLFATSPGAQAQERSRRDNYRNSGQGRDASYVDDRDGWWERSRYYNEDEWFDPTAWFDGNNYEFAENDYHGDRGDRGGDRRSGTARSGSGRSGSSRSGTGRSGTARSDYDRYYDHYAFPQEEQNAIEKVQQGSYSDSGRPPDRTVTVFARGLDFEPAEIQARPGEKLLIKLINESQQPHNIEFELPDGEAELEHNVAPGGSASLMFVAPAEPGSYTFYCPVGNHQEQGMQGKLIVGDARATQRQEN